MPNLAQSVTQTAIRGRCGGARTNRRCGGINTRKLHGRSRQQGGRRRRLQDSLRGDHLRRGPPIPGGPIEAREQASDNETISRQSEQSMKKRPNPATAHTQSRQRGAQTTSRSSARVRGRSTQFIANPCRWPQRPCPKRGHISAIFPPFEMEERECVWAGVDFVRDKGLTYTLTHPQKKKLGPFHFPFFFFFLLFCFFFFRGWQKPKLD